MRLLLLSDQKPGHLTSSRGIAQHLPETVVVELPIRFRSKQRDNRLRMTCRLASWASPSESRMQGWLESALTPESYTDLLQQNEVDAVLSTGSSVAAVNLCWGRILGVPTIVCRRPSPLGIECFDKVVLPRYQWPRRARENVIQTLGIPNQVTPVLLAKHRLREKHVPCIGVLIGGEDDYFTMTPETAAAYAAALLKAVESVGVTFALTTSRRTPVDAEQVLTEQLAHHELCTLFVSPRAVASGNVSGARNGQSVMMIMAMSDTLLVTEDSYSMVCEALSSSRPVVLLQMDRKKHSRLSKQVVLPDRLRDFQVMADQHCLFMTNHPQLESRIERTLALGWPQPPLRDAEHAAHEIMEWMQIRESTRN